MSSKSSKPSAYATWAQSVNSAGVEGDERAGFVSVDTLEGGLV